MAGRLMDEDPQQALAHARAARALAGRVGAVREANGLVAYTAGEWAEALSELRAARRMTGEPDHLAVMADCERALGRPDRALLVVDDPQAKGLPPAARVELMIVASGARRDMGQAEAAVAGLQVPALEGPVRPWTARLRYAYADALLEAGREDEARQWFARAAEVDEQQETDAEERLLELDGMVLEDLLGDQDDEADGSGEDVPAGDVSSVGPFSEKSTTEASSQVRGLATGEGPALPTDEPASDEPASDEPRAEEPSAGEGRAVEPGAEETAGNAVPTAVPPVPMSVAEDESPAFERAGSTGLGFVEPTSEPTSEPAHRAGAAGAERSGADPGARPGADELRLFD